jgi:nickel-dependent lactate racemase
MATASTTARGFLDELQGAPVRIDQWQLEECAKVAVDHECVLVASGIPDSQRRRLFIRTATTLHDAVREGIRRHGPDARIAVIPKGPYTLVRLPG